MAGWFDSHTHFDYWRIEDVPGVVRAAEEAGVSRMLTVGRSVISSEAQVFIAHHFDSVVAGVGIHPGWNDPLDDQAYKTLKGLTSDEKVVAIAETGIGVGRSPETRDQQREKLARHIRLGRETGLPVIMHSDQPSGPDIAEIYEKENAMEIGGVMHGIMVDLEWARRIWEMGCYISIGFHITREGYEYLEDVARECPEDQLIIETDSAGGLGGGTPAMLIPVAEKVAALRGISMDKLQEITVRNTNNLLKLS